MKRCVTKDDKQSTISDYTIVFNHGGNMIPENRREVILSILKEKGYCSVEALASKVYVSVPTIRRDLSHLHKEGLIKRVHGGASYFQGAPQMLPFDLRKKAMSKEKIKIGETAARLLNDHDTLFLDSSSTCLCLAKAIDSHQKLNVLTNSFLIAQILAEYPEVTVEIVGGIYQPTNLSTYGHEAESNIAKRYAKYCFVTVNSVDQDYGFSNITETDIGVKRAFAQHAEKVIMLVDSSKLYRKNYFKVFDFHEIDILITDKALDEPLLEVCRLNNIHVMIAP